MYGFWINKYKIIRLIANYLHVCISYIHMSWFYFVLFFYAFEIVNCKLGFYTLIC